MSAPRRFGIAAVAAIAFACSGGGPPRPDESAAPFPMPNPPDSGLPNAQSYRTQAGDIVLDEVTGLSWQGSVNTGPGESGGFVWQDAVDHCDALVQGGHDDFRLPTRLELVTIVDSSATDPAVDAGAFPATPSEAYWTVSSVATDPEQSFYLNFFFGYTSTNFRVYEQFARCVRTDRRPELPGADRFRIDGGTAIDRMTGLRWERSPSFEASKFDDARAYCAGLVINGNGSFRMPSMKELQTLVDETRTDIAIDPVVFPGASGDAHWSATLLVSDPASAWFVRFSDGYSQFAALETQSVVRCVR